MSAKVGLGDRSHSPPRDHRRVGSRRVTPSSPSVPASGPGASSSAPYPRAVPLPTSDAAWDARYPPDLRVAAPLHFVPLATARAASDWLAQHARASGKPVVDLGAGAGKFVLAAADRHPGVEWVGLELRASLLGEAERWRREARLANVGFAKADITAADLGAYAGAFCFNPFYEQLDASARGLGDGLPRGRAAYRAACASLRENVARVGPGFALATYFCHGPEIPAQWRRTWEAEDGRLVGWRPPPSR